MSVTPPKEVLHVLNVDAVGGVEHLFHNLIASGRARDDQRDHVLVTGGRIHPHFARGLRKGLASTHYSKTWHGLKIPKRPRLVRQWRQTQIMAKVRPDLAVLWNRFGDLAIVDSLRRTSAATVYYEHGAAWLAQTNARNNEFVRSVDSVICASVAARRVYELRWGYQGGIKVVLNCLRPDMLPDRPLVKSIPKDRPILLGIAARLVPLKGVGVALHALRQLRFEGHDVELRIAGTGPLEGHLARMAKDLEIHGAVTFCGCLEDMSKFYQQIDLLIVPSVREPFGMVIIEAGAHGCPSVATRVDGIPEALVDQKTGLSIAPELELEQCATFGGDRSEFPDVVYNPENDRLEPPRFLDPKRLAKAVASLLDDPAKYHKFSAAAAQHARDGFNAETYAERLRACFSEVLSARNL